MSSRCRADTSLCQGRQTSAARPSCVQPGRRTALQRRLPHVRASPPCPHSLSQQRLTHRAAPVSLPASQSAVQLQNLSGKWIDAPPILGTFVVNVGKSECASYLRDVSHPSFLLTYSLIRPFVHVYASGRLPASAGLFIHLSVCLFVYQHRLFPTYLSTCSFSSRSLALPFAHHSVCLSICAHALCNVLPDVVTCSRKVREAPKRSYGESLGDGHSELILAESDSSLP